MVSSSTVAATGDIDEAVKRYYAGFPDDAIGMLKPMALSGDIKAQYLLGNIYYSLSKTGNKNDTDDAIEWYEMAAKQNSAEANYALGVIFHNRWIESRDSNLATTAINYYRKAIGLGYQKAQQPLTRIKSRSGISEQKAAALVQDSKTTSISQVMVQASATESDNLSTDEKQAPKDSSAAQNRTARPGDPATASKTAPGEPITIARTEEQSAQETPDKVTLAEIAEQCQNYTEAGFRIYAETIKGALVSGIASMAGARREATEPGTYVINLTNNQFGNRVILELHEVPGKVALAFKEGIKYPVTGTIVDSKLVGSRCAVSAKYQSDRG